MSERKTAYLVYKIGDEPEQIVLWDTLDVTIGRFRTQDIVVADPEVSREHAVLRRQDGAWFAQDKGTGLGTIVNGERIQVHELAHGDEVRVGPLRMKFGLTSRTLRAGGNTRFASELKAGVLPGASTEGNRTMLGFQPETDARRPAEAPTTPSGPRALAADGSLEDLGVPDVDLGALASQDVDDLLVAPGPPPRDLDAELAAEGMGPAATGEGTEPDDPEAEVVAEDAPTQPAFAPPPAAEEDPGLGSTAARLADASDATLGMSDAAPGQGAVAPDATEGETPLRARMELLAVLEGPPEALKSLADALIDREIRVDGVDVRVARRRG